MLTKVGKIFNSQSQTLSPSMTPVTMVVVIPAEKSALCLELLKEESLIEIRRSSGLAADSGLGGFDVHGNAPRHVGSRNTWGASHELAMTDA